MPGSRARSSAWPTHHPCVEFVVHTCVEYQLQPVAPFKRADALSFVYSMPLESSLHLYRALLRQIRQLLPRQVTRAVKTQEDCRFQMIAMQGLSVYDTSMFPPCSCPRFPAGRPAPNTPVVSPPQSPPRPAVFLQGEPHLLPHPPTTPTPCSSRESRAYYFSPPSHLRVPAGRAAPTTAPT